MESFETFSYSVSKKSIAINQNTINKGKKASSKIVEEVSQQFKSQTVNIPLKKEKVKSKMPIPNPSSTYEKIYEWRKTHIAPVDTMGCERLSQRTEPEEVQKFQTLISLMLSVQTKDQTTSATVKILQQYGLNPKKMSQINEQKLIEMIYKCNFNRRKAKNIIEVSKIILKNGMPKTKEDLLALPGVGVKIAMIYLREAEGLDEGIGVDTHVHRISNLLGWVKTNNPNDTEEKLQQIFPKKHWKTLNLALVGFGQIQCPAKKPLCISCPVQKQCPSSMIKSDINDW